MFKKQLVAIRNLSIIIGILLMISSLAYAQVSPPNFTYTESGAIINLEHGFNIISLPVEPVSLKISDIFQGVGEFKLAYWDPIGQDAFKFNNMDDMISADYGYYINVDQEQTVTIEGDLESKIITLFPGWNLVSYRSPVALDVSIDALDTISFSDEDVDDIEQIWAYTYPQWELKYLSDPHDPAYQDYGYNPSASFIIQPGQIYFIYANTECIWIPPQNPQNLNSDTYVDSYIKSYMKLHMKKCMKECLLGKETESNNLLNWRENFCGSCISVKNPFIDNSILDFMMKVPTPLRRGKFLFRKTQKKMFPQLFNFPRASFSSFLSYVYDAIKLNINSINNYVNSKYSVLDDIIQTNIVIDNIRYKINNNIYNRTNYYDPIIKKIKNNIRYTRFGDYLWTKRKFKSLSVDEVNLLKRLIVLRLFLSKFNISS